MTDSRRKPVRPNQNGYSHSNCETSKLFLKK